MKAVQVTTLDGPEAVEIVELDEPVAGPTDVVIDVKAIGVSFVDVLMTRGQYQVRPELPFVPGVEVSGVVRSAPADALVAIGDRCVAHVSMGGYAEVVAASAPLTFPLPDPLTFHEGAALAVNFQTAYFALIRRGRLKAGEHVLVLGGGGGVGTAAIQIAKGFGATVTAVVSSQSKAEVAAQAGADHVVMLTAKDWVADVRGGGGPVDITVDSVGGAQFAEAIRLLRAEGRHLVIGFAAGEIPTIGLNRLLLKNIEVVGVYWGGFVEKNASFVADAGAELARLAREGYVRPVIGGVYSLAEAPRAMSLIEHRSAEGKIVLEPGAAAT